jgi:hypothetical protein
MGFFDLTTMGAAVPDSLYQGSMGFAPLALLATLVAVGGLLTLIRRHRNTAPRARQSDRGIARLHRPIVAAAR